MSASLRRQQLSRTYECWEALPWVRRLKKPHAGGCDGFHGASSGRRRCRNPAYWSFRASKRSDVDSGHYCISHISSRGIHGDVIEERRAYAWWYEHGYLCPSTLEERVTNQRAGRTRVVQLRCCKLNTHHLEHVTSLYQPYHRWIRVPTWPTRWPAAEPLAS